MLECNKIIDEYIRWIRDNTVVKTIEEGQSCLVSSPFLDRHNDHLNIYIVKNGSNYQLTDDGYTINDLKMSGLEINTPKREKIFRTVLNGFGVKTDTNNALYVEASINNIGQKKHHLLQAILAVNDMYTLSQEMVYSLFKEDVELYLKSNEIYFSKDIKITGKTGFDHNIDFLITASKTKPERLIKTVNNPKRDAILSSIFAFTDIVQVRDEKTNNYVVYNDVEKSVTQDVLSALSNYGVKHIPWSEKERCIEEFSVN
ncbi:MAG: DUF1828 domain-containing protein [Bacteroidetes bacterium]|nr:MAG: DUF1828 domain-containing protein [Bacteroidota bacterium]